MRILFYGCRGWIGTQISDALIAAGHEILNFSNRAASRAENYKEVCAEIDGQNADYVFCSVGRTHGYDQEEQKQYNTIDYLELPGKLDQNVTDNLVAPLTLARACRERGIKMAYIGTGCIFQYDAEHQIPSDAVFQQNEIGFTEQDEPNFFGSAYSTVKGWTDAEMRRKYSDRVLNLRIRMPITDRVNPRNFITKITTYKKICSVPNSMTVLPNLIPIIVHMVTKKDTGTYNMCNPGVISHNQILDMYREHVDTKFQYRNFSVAEQAQILKAGRSNNYLQTEKLEDYCRQQNLLLLPIAAAVEVALKKFQT